MRIKSDEGLRMLSLYIKCVVDVNKKSRNIECVSLYIKMCSLLKMCPLNRFMAASLNGVRWIATQHVCLIKKKNIFRENAF
jgi:hypothetical protein